MRILIVTGLSGAGKTGILRHLEDNGFLCVDNLPPMLIPKFLELCKEGSTRVQSVALAVDIRSGEFFDARAVCGVIEDAVHSGYPVETLFLEASDDALISRYKETRRDHPLATADISLTQAIAAERERLQPLRETASYVLDTTNLRMKQASNRVDKMLLEESENADQMRLEILSFGFKRGIPRECDLVFDVRFLPNPFYMPDIAQYTGQEKPVRDFVLQHPVTQEFLQHLYSMLDFLLPHYREEGKRRLMIGIGCTGGAHRSVAISEALGQYFQEQGIATDVNHRDIELEKMSWQMR